MSHSYTLYRYNPSVFLGEAFYDWRKYVFQKFAGYLCSRGLPVKIEDRKSFDVALSPFEKKPAIIRDSLAILQNDQTGDYYVLDCHDMLKTDELELIVRDKRCKKILKCQYRASVFKDDIYQKVRPWTYFDRFWPENEKRLVEARGLTRISDSLYFRGADWAKRGPVLKELSKRNIIKPDFEIINYDDYFRESIRHPIMLSLPGMADICNRDVEGFGSGTCVLRPKIRNEFYNVLIPDYHYISVDIKLSKTDPQKVADSIEQRFREVIDNRSYIASVVKHAARWYDENVRMDASMKLTAKLLDLCQGNSLLDG